MPPIISIGGVHLSNSTGAQVAGGTATAAATTPFAFRGVTLNAAPPETFYSGGAPFTLGARPVYHGYENVTQTWPLNVQGATHEGAAASLQVLKLAIQRALFDQAAILAIQPTASSTIMYAEVYAASVQEVATEGLIPIEGATDVDFELTFTRSPFFTPAGLTTLINGATFTNTGTGANNNTQSLGSLAGDMIYEGQPLNIKIVTAVDALFAATVYQRTYTAGVATTATSDASAGASALRDSTSGITNPARTRNGLRARVLLRLTALSVKAQLRAVLVSRVTNDILWYGPWIQPGVLTGAIVATGSQFDLTPQGIPMDMIRRAQLTSGDLDVAALIRSQDGTSVSITTHSIETLLYYTFCRINTGIVVGGGSQFVRIEQAQNLNGTAYLAVPGATYVVNTSGSDFLTQACDVRGTLPLAISGASLYLSWLGNGYQHTNTATAVVTVTHLPLYRSIRGTT